MARRAARPPVATRTLQTTSLHRVRGESASVSGCARSRLVDSKRRENPSPAAAQRYREYLLWTETRPVQFGDEPPNDTYEIFMKERRRAKEKARLQGVARKRQAERQLQRQTVVSDAALASPAAQPAAKRPRGRPADPNTEQRRRDRRELQREKSLAQQHRRDARDAARAGQQVRSTLQFMELNLTRAKAAGFNP